MSGMGSAPLPAPQHNTTQRTQPNGTGGREALGARVPYDYHIWTYNPRFYSLLVSTRHRRVGRIRHLAVGPVDWDAEDRAGSIPRLGIIGLIEAVVLIRVVDLNRLARENAAPGDALANREADNLALFYFRHTVHIW